MASAAHASTTELWSIEFTDDAVASLAHSLSDDLAQARVPAGRARFQPPEDATLGTPEIIVTIAVTAAAKSLIVAGLTVLRRRLEAQPEDGSDRRVQIVLTDPVQAASRPKRFPINLRGVGKDTLKAFIDQIVSVVEKL